MGCAGGHRQIGGIRGGDDAVTIKPEIVEKIIRLYRDEGLSMAETAVECGVSEPTVRRHLHKHNVEIRHQWTPWSEEEKNRLVDLVSAGLTDREMTSYFPNRTHLSIHQMKGRMRIWRRVNRNHDAPLGDPAGRRHDDSATTR